MASMEQPTALMENSATEGITALKRSLALVNSLTISAQGAKLTMLRNALVVCLCTFAFADAGGEKDGNEDGAVAGAAAAADSGGGSGGMMVVVLGVVATVALIKIAKSVVVSGAIGGGVVGDSVLLLGCLRAGKTALFHRMLHGDAVKTVTSMAAAERTIAFGSGESAATVNVIDFPGHRRLRGGLAAVLRRAKAIVFVVDSATVANDLTAIAEFLYEVLTDRSVSAAQPPVLFACNKQDARLAKAPSKVRSMVEKEMEELSSTRSSMEEEGGGALASLGRADEEFDFEVDCPCKVSFVGCSAAAAEVDEVRAFIAANLS